MNNLLKSLVMGVALISMSGGHVVIAQDAPPVPENNITATTRPAAEEKPKPYIGIGLDEDLSALGQEKRDALNLPAGSGMLIEFVQDDSPADEAGMRQGMVIARVDGQPVFGVKHFVGLLKMKKPGDSMVFTVVSEDGAKDYGITVGKRPALFKGEIQVQKGNPQPVNIKGPHALTDTRITIKDAENIIVISVKPDGQQSIVVHSSKDPDNIMYQGPMTTAVEQEEIPWHFARKIRHFYNQDKLNIKWYRLKRSKVMDNAENPGPNNAVDKPAP